MTWTIDFVEQQAPDPASMKAGYKQANAAKWRGLGTAKTEDRQVLWGEIRGSGSKAYRTQIDLNGPAFKCTCPSRKFPCKHGIGLGLVYAQSAHNFVEQNMPDWVEVWIKSRQVRAQKKIQSLESEKNETDYPNQSLITEEQEALQKKALAKAKRLESRIKKVTQGLLDLERRLQDLVRNGLASIKEPDEYWDQVGARLVDAQASALAKRVRTIPFEAQSPQEVLREIAYLHLVCQAWSQRENLSELELADLKAVIGFSVSQDALTQKEGLSDHWILLGIEKEQEQQLSVLKQWLYGIESGQLYLLLSYAFYNQPHPHYFKYSQILQAELCAYEGNVNQRACLKRHQVLNGDQRGTLEYSDLARSHDAILNPYHNDLRGFIPLDDLLTVHAKTLSLQPWASQRAYLIKNVLISKSEEGLFVYSVSASASASASASYSHEYTYLKIQLRPDALWQILAITGAKPAQYLALWNSQYHRLTLLSLIHCGQVYPLG